MTKLLGYRFNIEYKRGKENSAANALSRILAKEEITSQLRAMSAVNLPEWVDKLKEESKTDEWLIKIKQQIEAQSARPDFQLKDGIIFFKNRFCLGPTSDLPSAVMKELHGSQVGGTFWGISHISSYPNPIFLGGNDQGHQKVHLTMPSMPTSQGANH